MTERKISAWITIKHHHIPIYEGETKQDVINRLKFGAKKGKENRPVPEKDYTKKRDAAEKAVNALQQHQERVNRANELIKTDTSAEAQKEKLNADRTFKEAMQRYSTRQGAFDAIKNRKQIKSYEFRKKQVDKELSEKQDQISRTSQIAEQMNNIQLSDSERFAKENLRVKDFMKQETGQIQMANGQILEKYTLKDLKWQIKEFKNNGTMPEDFGLTIKYGNGDIVSYAEGDDTSKMRFSDVTGIIFDNPGTFAYAGSGVEIVNYKELYPEQYKIHEDDWRIQFKDRKKSEPKVETPKEPEYNKNSENTPVHTVSDEEKNKLKELRKQASIERKQFIHDNMEQLDKVNDENSPLIRKYKELNNKYFNAEYEAFSVMPPVPLDEDKWKSGISALTREEAIVARKDMLKNKEFYLAIQNASAGTGYSDATIDTEVDALYKKNKDLYDVFEPTRKMLKEKYGEEMTLYRAGTSATDKTTINMASTKNNAQQYADIYGSEVSSKKVKIDDILAVNIARNGGYEEFIVLNNNLKHKEPTSPTSLVRDKAGSYSTPDGRFTVKHEKGTHRVNIPGKMYSELRGYDHWTLVDSALEWAYQEKTFSTLKEAQKYIESDSPSEMKKRFGKK